MDKYIYNEKNGLWYELQGDYYLPCLKLPEESEVHIGIWGQRHLRYLKQYHRVRYYNLLTSGKLNDYLGDVETQAQQMFDELVNALSRNENLTEDFKATDPMEWVRRSNCKSRGYFLVIKYGVWVHPARRFHIPQPSFR